MFSSVKENPSENEATVSSSSSSSSELACPPPPVRHGFCMRPAYMGPVEYFPPPSIRLRPVCYAAHHPSCMEKNMKNLDLAPESSAPLTAWDYYSNSVDFYLTVKKALKDALRDYRFTHIYRPMLPSMPAYKKNLQIVAAIDVMIIPLLETCEDYLDAHSIFYCGGVAACRLAGIEIADDNPTPSHIGTRTTILQFGWRFCNYEKIIGTIMWSKKYFNDR